ncbi:hypothetical protein N7495_007589 [Penicillium taxi]|uniref:uncharacterized protein n=1 Tax=Penicillium taxi TaxID=168475 RepID=UPI00254549FA|nr:uncharacterized protein N7495_007589 [Penicillium taxi]KAJ5887548.1 hypothetical protein N7495_007589 [Penicillium taxi]
MTMFQLVGPMHSLERDSFASLHRVQQRSHFHSHLLREHESKVHHHGDFCFGKAVFVGRASVLICDGLAGVSRVSKVSNV